ncbi:MAG: leucine-rich repeat protein [Paludibacter sp.]
MKKEIKISFALLLLSFASLQLCNLQASIAFPGLINFKQPDGSTIRIFLKGDEKAKWAETEDGYSIMTNSKGIYEYAVVQNISDMISSGVQAKNQEERSTDEIKMLSAVEKHLRFNNAQLSRIKEMWKIPATGTMEKVFPTKGARKLVCILMDFPDKKFTKVQTDFDNLFNKVGYTENAATGSVRDYFLESSYNQFDLSVTVVGPFTTANNMAYYGGNNSSGNDLRDREFAAEAINLGSTAVNFADFDNDNDGTVDGVYIIYAGYGEEAGGPADCIWAHAWNLITPIVKNGKTISKYSTSCELKGNTGTTTAPIGVICHEFGHVLGAPDFYDTNYATNGQYAGTGKWDLQGTGLWLNGGITPAHPNAYTKCYIYNWATATTLSTQQTLTVKNSNQDNTAFYRINTTTSNEYYLLENRQKIGFNGANLGNGLLVYHVDGNYITSNFSANNINSTSHQGLYVVPAGSTAANGIVLADLATTNSALAPFPGSSNKTSFTDTTTPSSLSWAGANTSKPITSITEDGVNKTITLDFMGGTDGLPPTVQASNLTFTNVSDNSMTLNWSRGNGKSVMVLLKAYSDVTDIPGGGTYTASSVYGSGSQLGQWDYSVYIGTGTSVTVTGLVSGTKYYAAVFEYNFNPNVYMSPALTGNATTTGMVNFVYASAGNLATILGPSNLSTITTLKLTGSIDARDFKTMRDNMPALTSLDLSDVSISPYSGPDGTFNGTNIGEGIKKHFSKSTTGSTLSGSYSFPGNAIPAYAFLDPGSFTGKTGLKTLILPSNLNAIGTYAFYGCTGLAGVLTIPNQVNSIESYAFYNCTGITDFKLSTTLSSIGDYSFYMCSGISTFTLPASLSSIGTLSFGYCSSNTKFVIDAANLSYSVLNGVLFNIDQTRLVSYPAGKSGAYSIPATVLTIGANAFYGCNLITSVTIPNSLTSIENHGFCYNNLLTTILTVSDQLKYMSIDGVLFNKNLTDLIICPSGKTGSYTIPGTVTTIHENAFFTCSNLTSVSIPPSVISIGNTAFANCTGLTSIYANLPTPIDLSASTDVFVGVNKTNCVLNVLYKAKSLYVTANQWSDFSNITEAFGFLLSNLSVNFPANGGSTTVNITSNTNWMVTPGQVWVNVTPTSGTGNNTLTINADANTTTEGRNATITISAVGVQSQVINVYQAGVVEVAPTTQASNLTFTGIADNTMTLNWTRGNGKSVIVLLKIYNPITDIPGSGTYTASSVYGNGTQLGLMDYVVYTGTGNTVTVTGLVPGTKYYASVFECNTSINSYLTPALSGNTSTTGTVNYVYSTPGNLATILGTTNLAALTTFKIVGTLDARDFKTIRDKMPLLASVDLSDAVIVGYIGSDATYSGSYNYGANSIPAYSFYNSSTSLGKTVLKSIVFPTTLTSIGQYAFYGCSGLAGTLTIPNSVTTIETYAFYNCTAIADVKLSTTLANLGDFAFMYCNSVATFNIPASLTNIGYRPFGYCVNHNYFVVDPDNPNYASPDGVLFNKDLTKLVYIPTGRSGTYLVPPAVQIIGSNAFYGCKLITSVTIPNNVSVIESRAFGYNSLLTGFVTASDQPNLSVSDGVLFNKDFTELIVCPSGKSGSYTIPATVNTIRESGFIRCEKLTSIVIPKNVTKIDTCAFFYCSALTNITIPETVTYFGGYSFYACLKLASVTIPSITKYIGTSVFAYCNALTAINANPATPVNLTSSPSVFYNVNKTNCKLNVPIGSKSLYQAATSWKDFINIMELATEVKNPSDFESKIDVFPNPVSDSFKINGIDGNAIVTFFDSGGKELYSKQIFDQEDIYVGNLPEGIYMLKIASKDITVEKKLFKK